MRLNQQQFEHEDDRPVRGVSGNGKLLVAASAARHRTILPEFRRDVRPRQTTYS